MGIIKKSGLCLIGIFLISGHDADAIETGVCKVSSCHAGYYLYGSSCVKCPDPGTSISSNTGAITSCYISSGSMHSDASGTFTYTSNCNYSN